MRFWLGLTSLAVAAATSSVARAEVPADSIEITLKTPEADADPASTMSEDFSAPTDDVRPRQFNRARCECDEDGDVQNVMFEVKWKGGTQPPMRGGTQLYAWVGSDCANAANLTDREMKCSSLAGIPDAITIDMVEEKFVGVGALLTPGTNNPDCSDGLTSVTYGIYTSPDSEASIMEVGKYKIDVDMKAPPVPTELTVLGQEGQIGLDWEPITSEAGDIDDYYALCAKADGTRAHEEEPDPPAEYDTVDSQCGGAPIANETPTEVTITNDAQLTGAPIVRTDLGDLEYLDKAYLCGHASGTASEITLGDLQNGVEYMVVLVAADKAGNARAVYVPRLVSPQPVTDFWEDANAENPEIEGGLCLVESTYGAGGGGLNGMLRAWRDELRQTTAGRWLVERYYAWGAPLAAAARESVVARVVIGIAMLPLVAIALVWHLIGLPAMLALTLGFIVLRRRRTWLAAAAITLAPTLAAAQSMTPYWDDELASESAETAGPKWHFGLRLGPYLPSIDDERFMSPGPYEQMFGGGSWMPAADLHRLFGTRFGQFGGGISVGYFGKTADAYIPGTDPPVRAEGNKNSLKIVPVELTAIWRASQLHDNWGIPLVPYLRGGAGYYLWWVRRPDGELAKACPENMTNCDRAIGASMGLVGAAGLAIRAEGIDPSAARSMRDSGLDHAGFYAEVEMAWVDGFGSPKKLSLGDTTWFAGIDFEF